MQPDVVVGIGHAGQHLAHRLRRHKRGTPDGQWRAETAAPSTPGLGLGSGGRPERAGGRAGEHAAWRRSGPRAPFLVIWPGCRPPLAPPPPPLPPAARTCGAVAPSSRSVTSECVAMTTASYRSTVPRAPPALVLPVLPALVLPVLPVLPVPPTRTSTGPSGPRDSTDATAQPARTSGRSAGRRMDGARVRLASCRAAGTAAGAACRSSGHVGGRSRRSSSRPSPLRMRST